MKLSILFTIIAAAAILAFTSACEKGPDGYDVDKKAVVLEAYGPNPVLRGNDLTFIGQNLDKVTAVILPADIEIPASEFKDAGANSFKVTVPVECEPGTVTLVYGENYITSKSSLSYTEQFEISSVHPQEEDKEILQAGDSVSVEGEYLNNIVRFVFENGGASAEGELIGTHTRHLVCFAVPAGAMSGRIYAEDANGNQVYPDEILTIRQPEITDISPVDVRPGDKVTITGTLLDQIVSLSFTGSSDIESADFDEISASSITVTVPADVHDGPVTLVSAAGQKISTEASITVAVPSGLSFAEGNVYKSGETISIEGADLDLVTGAVFTGNSASGTFSFSDGILYITIPDTASDGVITLSTAAGKSVTTETVTLAKPVITSVSAESVLAGESFSVEGTDLDLVTTVTLNGENCLFSINSETSITITTSATSTAGKISLTAANGYTAVSSQDIQITYASIVIVSSLTGTAGPDGIVTMEGSSFNMIESIYIGDTKVTSYLERSDTWIEFTMPEGVQSGKYNPRFVLTTGEEEICALAIEVAGTSSTIPVEDTDLMLMDFEGSHNHTAWAGGSEIISEEGNSYLRISSDIAIAGSGGWILNCNDYPEARSVNAAENYVARIDVFVPEGWSDTGAIAYQLVFSGWHWYGLNMFASLEGNGSWQTLEIPLSYWNLSGLLEIGANTEVGLYLDQSSSAGLPVGMCFDNFRLSLKD